MRYVNCWTVSCLWVAGMIAAWFTIVPGVLSPSSWLVATVGGPILFVGASAFMDASRTTPSFGQTRAAEEAAAAERRQG